jgi:hypothetical protein
VVASVVAVLETVVESVVLIPHPAPILLCDIFSNEDESDFFGDDFVKFSGVPSSGVLHSIGDREVFKDAGVI